jgi:phosphoenolpyruvate---glycerone phosphotransferase subunit DhaL
VSTTFDAAAARRWVQEVARAVKAKRDHLTQLDTAIGDGDHGVNLDRGFRAATEALDTADADTPAAVLQLTGRTLISTVGGASGPLYGTAFRETAKALGTSAEPDAETVAAALRAGLDGIRRLGKAEDGDKTMVDAYAPAVAACEKALADGASLATAADAAAEAAEQGAQDTVPLQARKGRASYLGARSVGHLDPGAASTALAFSALRDALDPIP